MEEEYLADRVTLRQLRTQHPAWHIGEYMAATHRSRSWVKKWLKRFAGVAPDDEAVVHGQSHVAKHLPPRLSEAIVARILDIRDHPPICNACPARKPSNISWQPMAS